MMVVDVQQGQGQFWRPIVENIGTLELELLLQPATSNAIANPRTGNPETRMDGTP
ncbi:MAG: hypothetical protein U5O69_11030 [Candidatus Competibacteraceae bacterium]|nr:hypothetical protein [Candidatus Competibacteraceae bacterium]